MFHYALTVRRGQEQVCLDTSLQSQTDSTGRHRRNYNTIRVVKTGLCCSLSKIKFTKGCFWSDAIHL